MKGFVTGMLLGVAAGAAADMVMNSKNAKRSMGKAVRSATNAVENAASAMQQSGR